MKIVLVNYRYFKSSGAETFMFKFKELLEDHGHTVIPFSTKNSQNIPTPYEPYFAQGRSSDNNVLYDRIRKTPKNILRMLAGAFYNPEAKQCLLKLLKAEKPDLVFVLQQMNTLSPSIFEAAKTAGVPVIHRLSDFNLLCPRYDCLRDGKPCTECLGGRYIHAVRYRCVKGSLPATLVRSASMKFHKSFRLFGGISRFIVPARFTAELMKKDGIPAERVVCMPTFIDASAITPEFEGGQYFLFFGRLSPEKGISELIEAMSLMRHKDAKLVLVGNHTGGDLNAWYAKVRDLGLEERVEFRGYQSGAALSDTIRGAIAVVMPVLWYENLPNTVLEAYAYGKPVISSDIGSMPELVEHEKTGLLCKPGDPQSISEALDFFAEHTSEAERMGRLARKKCEIDFDPEEYYRRMIALFEEVLEENRMKVHSAGAGRSTGA